MAVICSNVLRILVTVYALLFCEELAYRVGGDTTVMVATVGDDITLRCYPPRYEDNPKCWYRGEHRLAKTAGLNDNPPSFKKFHNESESLYAISLHNANVGDSATYMCYSNDCQDQIMAYELHVIGCSCGITHHDNPTKEKIYCYLDNFSTTMQLRLKVTINRHLNKNVVISGNFLSFAYNRDELYNGLQFQFNPYSNGTSTITCTVPALLTSPHPSQNATTAVMPSTWNERSAASHRGSTASHRASTENALTKQHTPQKKDSTLDNRTGNGNVTLIIAILGSVFTLILTVIIIALLCKKTKDRQKGKTNRNVSINNQEVAEQQPEGDYDLTEDESRREPEYTNSIEMLRKSNRDDDVADYLSIDVSTANVPNDYMALIPASSRFTESVTTDNKTCDMAEYVNSSIRDRPKWKGVSPQPEDQYDDVSIPDTRDDGDENLVYSDIQ